MTRKLTTALALCALAWLEATAHAQNGPDNDADGLPGYTNSVFHHAAPDSVNLYNGQLTVPVALGPSYPVGPRLRAQLALTYNSRVWEYGHPGSPDPLFTYTPVSGDPALGLGWTLTLGAIKTCPEPCFVGADGSRHVFDTPINATDYKTSDASPLYLRRLAGSSGWRMWDGDGNRYDFAWQVAGFDDQPLAFTRDFGRGRDGWYASSVTDPFGNAYFVDYFDSAADGFAFPCWGYLDGRCAATGHMVCAPAGATRSWIVKRVRLPGGSAISVHLDAASRVSSIDFPVLVAGAATYATWTMSYDSAPAVWPCAYGTTSTIQVARLTKIALPSGIAGSPAHLFGYGYTAGALLTHLQLPAGGTLDYCYSPYTFFHGRIAAMQPGCGQQTPPPDDPDAIVQVAACPVSAPDDGAPLLIPGPCGQNSPPRWMDTQLGISRRTERASASAPPASTAYTQYAFPWGERGSPSDTSGGSQTLTVAVTPPDADGHAVAKATLFWSGPKVPSASAYNGDRIGADLEERVFDLDPNPPAAPIPMPACGPLAAPEQPFCASKAVRVTTRTWAYDIPASEIHNRRLTGETIWYDHPDAAGSCSICPRHSVTYSNVGADTWEGNGRHFDVESHAGTLGGDARTVTTVWAPSGWATGPAAGAAVLPNLASQRTTAQAASARDEYFENDPETGFLRGSFVWDPARQSAVIECRVDDGDGNAGRQFTRTLSGFPSRTYCADSGFPGTVGRDGDTFGRTSTYQNGELLTSRWVDGSVSTPTFLTTDFTRDAATGWITSSRDTAGISTAYRYDALGRPTLVDPAGTPPAAGAELSTFVCYESPTATTAYRAAAAQACPVAPTNGAVSTWEHYDFDGLGRRIRERRLLPGAQVSKRFTLYDGPGRAWFESEWVADATAETFSRTLATACAFASNPAWPTARAAGAPGTLRLCHDPFGRPQQVVGSKHSSLATIDRSDAGHPYSVVAERTKTYCVNAPFADPQQATCAAGGLKPETTMRHDAFGRIVQVVEPTGDATAYGWDVRGALASVTQGGQSRTFQRDASGRLRSETTPEAGAATMDLVGSLGNVRQETRGGVVVTRDFDFAGRPTRVSADAAPYVVQCWDGAPTCVDGSPGYAGGAYPGGRLTRRYGYNRIPTIGPTADEQFEYSGGGGRLSRLVTSLGNGDLSASATQAWTYDGLGLAASHDHPRVSGVFSVATAFSAALPASLTAAGQPVVAAATWNAASGLASWRAGNSGTPVTVTIAPDASLLPRPASISSSVWSSGTYAYDGVGDVLSIGADSFGYDSRARLSSAVYGGAGRAFTYDRWGNLTSNGPTVIPIDPTTNRVSGGGAAYDSRGDMTAWGAEAMAWDGLARQYRNTNGSSDWVYLRTGAGERLARFPAKFGVLRREMARYVAEANVLAKGWTLPACGGAFVDVPCTDPDARYVQLVSDKGVTGGCATSPPQFCPDAALTRAQLAVFVVKGYKPDGFAPPACQGTFQDVACGGPYAAFAPWIEQLYRDGVTGGCATNPLRYCPGNAVGEWEALVWLAKAPGSTPGSFFWSAYHPVPRGTTYTWRDELGRVVTEASGGAAGPATATLTIARDNVFLGNLLVASYVASPPGWQYTVSDHLGSPRAVFNQSGQLVETHKHWPYGEDTSGSPPPQRLSFCLMERDSETTRYYDHARTHDYGLGRFLSPDSVGGRPENPQSWNRYAYTLGNPLKHVDPDGLLTIVVHGTWANGKGDFLPGGRFYEHVVSTAPDRAFASFQWSGANNHAARMTAAGNLAAFVNGYKFAPGEPLNIIAHSHGGNVAIMAINRGLNHEVDNLVTLGTPSRAAYRLIRPGDVANWVNLFNSHDGVQSRGGGDQESPFEVGPAARTHPYALNINWNLDFGPLRSHEELHSPPAWDFVRPHLRLQGDYVAPPIDYVID